MFSKKAIKDVCVEAKKGRARDVNTREDGENSYEESCIAGPTIAKVTIRRQ
jgi:hypothetical protein